MDALPPGAAEGRGHGSRASSTRGRYFKLVAVTNLLGMVACTAIAGLDGEFVEGGGDAGGPSTGDASSADGASNAPADSGADTFVAVDACAKAQPLDASTIPAPSVQSCKETDWIFCWDFTGALPPPNHGWHDSDRTAAGTLELWGDAGAANHNLLSATGSDASADSGSSLSFLDWNTNGGSNRDPIPIAARDTFDLQVSFKLTDTSRLGNLIAFAFNDETFGLRVYPSPCGARIGAIGEDPDTFLGGVVVVPDAWYRGRIQIAFAANGTFQTKILVGDALLAERSSVFSGGLPANIAPSLTVGLFRVGATGSSSVFIDDVILTKTND